MRSAIICLVLLGLLALCSASTELKLAHKLAKKSIMSTRGLDGHCQNAIRRCTTTLNDVIASVPVNDPQLEQKICRAIRNFYDCVKSGMSSCNDASLNQALADLLAEGRAACPREFQGATLLW